MLVLAADVGGTNARLALVDVSAGDAKIDGKIGGRLVARVRVPVAEQEGLEKPVNDFLEANLGDAPRPPACIAIAGTVIGRAAKVAGVNMPWTVDGERLERACWLPRVDLINDFHAAARGIELLQPSDLVGIGGGAPMAGQPIAVIGAGTGLGQAFVLPLEDGSRRIVPSEGGHRDFAPCTPLQDRLLVWLRGQYGRVSTERVLSGPGLVATYRFLMEVERLPACRAVEAASGADVGPQITAQALAGAHPTCVRALETFVDVYGAEAGNVALTVLSTGGVYLAGGIAPSVLTHPEQSARFRRAFDDKGRFKDFLDEIPVWVIMNQDLGLLGAAAFAAQGASRGT